MVCNRNDNSLPYRNRIDDNSWHYPMRFQIVDLEQAWWGKIEDFSIVRNRFLETLHDGDYILWKSRDEEFPESLVDYIRRLKPYYPYYDILRINLVNNQWVEWANRSEEHTSELQSPCNLVCRLLLEKKKTMTHCCL